MNKKHFLFTALLMLLYTTTSAQKNFEGVITFQYIVKGDKKPNTGLVTLSMNKDHFKLEKKSFSGIDENDDVLTDYAAGFIYHLHPLTKTCSRESLSSNVNTELRQVPVPQYNKLLLNTPCKAYQFADTDNKNPATEGLTFTFWYADTIGYSIPPQYLKSSESFAFTNGKQLGLSLVIVETLTADTVFQLIPETITWKPVPDSVFRIPADYKVRNGETIPDQSEKAIIDSVKTIEKQLSKMPRPKKSAPAKPASKSTNRTPANRPKE